MKKPIPVMSGDAVPETIRPAPERVLSGDPVQRLWNRYTDPTKQFHAGIWEGDAGSWRVRYDPHEEELCTLLAGHVRITDQAGCSVDYGPGDSFIIPGGFEGIWENLGPVRKVYGVTAFRTPDGDDAS